ncbi:type VI secretion system membrane subunit TssM [Aurantivibrio plasticivorans]
MRRFIDFITQGWFLSLLGIILLALIIWFVGPLIAIADFKPLASDLVRVCIIFVILVAWGLNNLRRQVKEQKNEKQVAESLMEDSIQSGPAAEKANPDEKILTKRLKDAISMLQASNFGKSGKLYALPWYMVIGAPGSGKTTALKNSGLHFPLAEQMGEQPIQGAGGTRYCDWWFTNEAILIDTAGRYTTQDNPKKIETAAWLGFLGRLKKVRPKRPLNGVIVTISIDEIINKTATQKSFQAVAIKQRIQELNNHLGMELPVYVIFTKLDTIAGFNSFFADLDQEDRDQILGFTFPEAKPGMVTDFIDQFSDSYTALSQQLNDRVLQRLSSEANPKKRALIYEFPRQMVGLRKELKGFLQQIFTPNQFEAPILWRGTYFLSSTQDHMTSRWVKGILPTDYVSKPVDVSASESKSFFVHRLLKDVVFAEANLASLSARLRMRYRWIYTSILVLSSVGFGLSLYAWHHSKNLNLSYISQLEQDAEDYQQITNGGLEEPHNWLMLANGLNELRDMPTGYLVDETEHASAQGFGLYQGEKLGAIADSTYLRALETFFMADLSKLLLNHVDLARNDDELLYESLKFYLMLYYPEHMDRESFTLWVNILWDRALPRQSDRPLIDTLNEHLNVALDEQVSPAPISETKVASAREILINTPLDLRIYRRLKNDYFSDNEGQFSVQQVLGKKSEVIFYRRSGRPLDEGIPELFTYSGFHTGFNLQHNKLAQQLADEQWIYGDTLAETLDEERIAEIKAKVNEYYFAEYQTRWDSYLNDLAIQSFATVNRGQTVARLLASSEKPLVKFLNEVRQHTALSEIPAISDDTKQAANELAEEFASSQKGRLERLVPKSVLSQGASLPGQEISEYFEDVNTFINAEEGLPLHNLQQTLEGLDQYFQSLAYSGNLNQAAFETNANDSGSNNALAGLKRAMLEVPSPLNTWFDSIARDTNQVTAVATQSHMNNVWRTEIYSFYERAIQGRYPLLPKSIRDIKLADFTTFFGPGGLLDSYYASYVEPFADTTTTPWRWQKNIGLSSNTLAMFERAQRIKQAYFGDSTEGPSVDFTVKPHSLEQVASGFILETGGNSATYNHGPVRTIALTWPGDVTNQSKIVFNLASRGTPMSARTDGEWSWFRLLDQYAQLAPKNEGDSLLVTFELNGISAQHELKPARTYNPFTSNDIKYFSVPERL